MIAGLGSFRNVGEFHGELIANLPLSVIARYGHPLESQKNQLRAALTDSASIFRSEWANKSAMDAALSSDACLVSARFVGA